MKIKNELHRVKRKRDTSWLEVISVWIKEKLHTNEYPLRFAVTAVQPSDVVIEVTTLSYSPNSAFSRDLENIEILNPRKKIRQASRFGVVQIVPTGVRCEFGGFAGDACPATNLLAATADFVVTHPNAVNASEINEMEDNVLYVEGKSLDDFLLGHLGLTEVNNNKIGTFIDPTGLGQMDYIINTLNAGNAVKGIDCDIFHLLKEELGVNIEWTAGGCAAGTVLKPEAILESVECLIDHGATAIGGVSVIHGVTQSMFEKHLQGHMPNPSGGVEAIITHLISKIFKIPSAHAPLPYYQDLKKGDTSNPRASAEFISTPHYFCVLKGLAKAPQLIPMTNLENYHPDLITINNIGAVVAPASCLGGIPAFVAEYNNIPLIAVKDNKTVLDVTNEKMQMRNVIEVESYLEAAGVVAALREGISLKSLRRPIDCVQEVYSTPSVQEVIRSPELELA